MRKIIGKAILPLASIMMLSCIPFSSTASACDDRLCDHSHSADDWATEETSNASGFVYDENGVIIDYWSGSDHDLFFAHPKCSSHDWESVNKISWSANGYQVKIYNRRCKKCCRYKYTTWSYSPVS